MLPKPQSRGDFLKVENLEPLLGKNRQVTATISGEPAPGKYGVDVPVEIGKAKTPFILTLGEKSRDYRTVADALGLDADEWDSHRLVLGIRDGKNKDGDPAEYVTVVRVE